KSCDFVGPPACARGSRDCLSPARPNASSKLVDARSSSHRQALIFPARCGRPCEISLRRLALSALAHAQPPRCPGSVPPCPCRPRQGTHLAPVMEEDGDRAPKVGVTLCRRAHPTHVQPTCLPPKARTKRTLMTWPPSWSAAR